jgi:hypothetical protein
MYILNRPSKFFWNLFSIFRDRPSARGRELSYICSIFAPCSEYSRRPGQRYLSRYRGWVHVRRPGNYGSFPEEKRICLSSTASREIRGLFSLLLHEYKETFSRKENYLDLPTMLQMREATSPLRHTPSWTGSCRSNALDGRFWVQISVGAPTVLTKDSRSFA